MMHTMQNGQRFRELKRQFGRIVLTNDKDLVISVCEKTGQYITGMESHPYNINTLEQK